MCHEQIIQHVWNNSFSFCIVFDKHGVIHRANKYAHELCGSDLINKSIKDVFLYFSNPVVTEGYISNPSEKHLVNVSTKNPLPTTLYFNFYPVGNNILAIGEVDNSEIEIMRTTLIETNNELSNLNRQLHKKQHELEKLNDVKNKILGVAAHDLRTPVGNILNISELLLKVLAKNLDDSKYKLLNAIHTSSKNLINLLNDLLDFSAIESGKLKLNLEKTNILILINQVVDLNTLMAENKNIGLTFNHPTNLPEITIDPIKIEQVLNNLISNAIKFSYPGSTIDLHAEASEEMIEITVTDHGQGIPKEEQNNIFKPFQQTSVQSTGNEKNTGLGLAIVWNIIKGHKGNIWIESEPGKGTTVHFTLPLNLKNI